VSPVLGLTTLAHASVFTHQENAVPNACNVLQKPFARKCGYQLASRKRSAALGIDANAELAKCLIRFAVLCLSAGPKPAPTVFAKWYLSAAQKLATTQSAEWFLSAKPKKFVTKFAAWFARIEPKFATTQHARWFPSAEPRKFVTRFAEWFARTEARFVTTQPAKWFPSARPKPAPTVCAKWFQNAVPVRFAKPNADVSATPRPFRSRSAARYASLTL